MARTSKGPRYFQSKLGWFAIFNGERIRLTSGPKKDTEKEAKQRYEEEKTARAVQTDADRGPCWVVLNAWLHWCQNRQDPPPVAPNTYGINLRFVQSFTALFGTVPTKELKPGHFDEWLAEMRKPRPSKDGKRVWAWDVGTRRLAMNTLRAAFTWAATSGGLIKVNPLALPGSEKLKTKRVIYKGRKLAITDEEHRLLLEQALKQSRLDFAELLMVWYVTGARPAEIYLARASEWDEANRCFHIQPTEENHGRFKLARLGEVRKIYVPDILVDLVRILMVKYPHGPVFRTGNGTPWSTPSVCSRFVSTIHSVNKRLGREAVRKKITAYSYRHAFVTRWLEKGLDPMHLCELLGTSLGMLQKHYSHLFEKPEVLRTSLNEAV